MFKNYIFVIIFTEVVYVYSQRIFKFSSQIYSKGISVECDGNPKYFRNVSCKIKPINWEHNVAYFDTDMVEAVHNISIHLENYKYTDQFRPFLINVTFNYCELFKNNNVKKPFIQSTLNVLAKYSNLYHECPYSGHLYIHDAYFDLKLMRFYVPLGIYKLVFVMYEGWPYIHIGTITYQFKIEERNSAARNKPKAGRSSLTN